MRELNQLLDKRNELVGEDDRVEMYDLMDAFDTVEQATEALNKEIENLLRQ